MTRLTTDKLLLLMVDGEGRRDRLRQTAARPAVARIGEHFVPMRRVERLAQAGLVAVDYELTSKAARYFKPTAAGERRVVRPPTGRERTVMWTLQGGERIYDVREHPTLAPGAYFGHGGAVEREVLEAVKAGGYVKAVRRKRRFDEFVISRRGRAALAL